MTATVHPIRPAAPTFDLAAEIRKVDTDYIGRLKALQAINKEAMLLLGKGAVMQAFIDALRDASREGATW